MTDSLVACRHPMVGFYGADTACARPSGHAGRHDQVWKEADWHPERSEHRGIAAELREWLDKPGPPVTLLYRAIHALEAK